MKKQAWKRGKVFYRAVILLGMAVCLAACGYGGRQSAEEETLRDADFFAYTDEENGLYLWEQGMDEPLLLTARAFAGEEVLTDGQKAVESGEETEGKEAATEYWKKWEYWQEWDDSAGQWVWNNEKALHGIVKESAEHIFCFPQQMRWESFCMERSAGECEDAQKYSNGEDTDSFARVRMFLFDLYCRDTEKTEGEEGNPERIAENVCLYDVDQSGNVWYCKVEENGTGEAEGTVYPSAGCMLYRYDGKEHIKIGEINGRRQGPFRVSRHGEYVIFYALDDGLYGCRPGEEAALLAEKTAADMFEDSGIYTDADMNKIIYMEGSTVHILEEKNREKERRMTGAGEYLMAGLLGEEGDKIFTLALEEEGSYADWLVREETDEDTKKLWELIEKSGTNLHAVLCHAVLTDLSSGQMECMEEKDGYLLSWVDDDGMETPRTVYYMEMIPADDFEKFTLSELFGEMTPAEILEACEEKKNDTYYEERYGEGYEEYAIAEVLDSCVDWEALKKRAGIYVVTANGMRRIEAGDVENIVVDGDYGENDILYLSLYRHMEYGKEDRFYYGYPAYYSYSYLEDRYALDGAGNCVKVAEAADETAVKGNEVFYRRITGMEGAVSLYRSGFDGPLAEAASISMESIIKSRSSDAVLFLVDGFMPEEEKEGVYVESEKDLLKSYRALTKDREDYYGEEISERTLMLHDGEMAKALEDEVYRYGFFGADNIWMMQYEEEEEESQENQEPWDDGDWGRTDGEESERKGGSRLFVYENGKKKQIAGQAVWMAVPENGNRSGTVSGKASWIYE